MSDFVDDFTVCVLLYGDFPELAERCLRSLWQFFPPGGHLRLALNACSERTFALVNAILAQGHHFSSAQAINSASNIHKYPMMRQMFYTPGNPITTPYVMWFDDDSYLLPPGGHNWLRTVHEEMQSCDMLGSVYKSPLCGNQHLWVRSQPWYNGRPVSPYHQFVFATGAWWVIHTDVLQRFDWPSPELDHCGGDVMLGELLRQHQLRLASFKDGVALNADISGVEAMAPRRGFLQSPIGWDYQPSEEESSRGMY